MLFSKYLTIYDSYMLFSKYLIIYETNSLNKYLTQRALTLFISYIHIT